jgi:hypothetical protein
VCVLGRGEKPVIVVIEAPDPPMDSKVAGNEMKVAMNSLSYSSNESPMHISLSASTGTEGNKLVGGEKKATEKEPPIFSPRPQNHYCIRTVRLSMISLEYTAATCKHKS